MWGQILRTPINRELLTSMETGFAHMMVLALFRNTLELKSPQWDSWDIKHVRKRKNTWKGFSAVIGACLSDAH